MYMPLEVLGVNGADNHFRSAAQTLLIGIMCSFENVTSHVRPLYCVSIHLI